MIFLSLLSIYLSLSTICDALPINSEDNDTSQVKMEDDIFKLGFIFDSAESDYILGYTTEDIIDNRNDHKERKRKHDEIAETILESNQKAKHTDSNVELADNLIQSNQEAQCDYENELSEEDVARLEEWFELQNRENQVEVIRKDNIQKGTQSQDFMDFPDRNVGITPKKNLWYKLAKYRNIKSKILPSFLNAKMIANPSCYNYMNFQDSNGDTPLHISVRRNDILLVSFFIQMRVDMNKKNRWSKSPLKIAVIHNNFDMIYLLIKGGAALNRKGSNLLIYSIQNCYYNTVKTLVQKGLDVNLKTKDHPTALHFATRLNEIQVVKLLLQYGADPLATDADGKTALEYCTTKTIRKIIRRFALKASEKLSFEKAASQSSKTDENQDLIDSHTIPSMPDENGDWPMHKAVRNRDYESVSELISKKMDVNQVNLAHETPLILAIKNLDEEMVARLIKSGANINQVVPNQKRPLTIAIQMHAVNLVRILVQNKANVNYCESDDNTPLQIAVQENSIKMVKILLKYGANHSALDGFAIKNSILKKVILSYPQLESNVRLDPFALHRAVESESIDEVTKLLASGADLNIKNSDEETPLLIAIRSHFNDIAKLLIQNSSKLYLRSKSYDSPFAVAVLHGNVDLVKFLISLKVDCNLMINNYTPLYIAAREGNLKIVEALLAGGAKINQLSQRNKTALHAAVCLKHKSVVEVLLNAGADYNAEDDLKKTPLELAKKSPEIHSLIINFIENQQIGINASSS